MTTTVHIRRGATTTPELVAILDTIADRLRAEQPEHAAAGRILDADDGTIATWSLA